VGCKQKPTQQASNSITTPEETLSITEKITWAECFNSQSTNANAPTNGWWADCCSTVHITNDINDVPNAQPYIQAVHVIAKEWNSEEILGAGQ